MEPIETKKSVVKCDGGGDLLGHPVVFLNLGTEGQVICPYCRKCYVMVIAYSMTDKTRKRLRRVSQ